LDAGNLKKLLSIELFHKQIEKNINMLINSQPDNEQDMKVISLLRDYKDKSTSGLTEARSIVKSHIKNILLTGFNLYAVNGERGLEDVVVYEGVVIDNSNGLIDCIIPFNEPHRLSPREKFEIILYMNRTIESNGRDGAFKKLLAKYDCWNKHRDDGKCRNTWHEYSKEDIEVIYISEDRRMSFADKVEIVAQRVYEELFGLMHIDTLAYSDVNEVGFSNNGKYIYCWCGRKVWLSFMEMSEAEARVVQERAISFEKHCPQLDVSHPEILVHRGDGARITATQQPYFSARNLCIRVFNQSSTSFDKLIRDEKLQTLITALVKTGESVCLQGSLGAGKTTTMNVMYELLNDSLHIGTVEDYFEQHIMDKYPRKRIAEAQAINGKSLLDAVKTLLRMSVDVANIGEVRDGNALFAFIQRVQSVSVAAWFTTHITNPETTVPRLKNMLIGTGRYFSEQSAVMDIIHSINMIFQHEIIDGQVAISQVVEIVPLAAVSGSIDYSDEMGNEELFRLYCIQQLQSNPYNMFRLNRIMELRDGRPTFLNYPSYRMVEKARKRKDSWEYIVRLFEHIKKDTGMELPDYARW